MKAVLQRVRYAHLSVDGSLISEIGNGLFLLLGVEQGDTEEDRAYLVKKCANIRIFEDENGKMNLSPAQVGAQILCVSQFTLLGDCSEGNRPFFGMAEEPTKAKEQYDSFSEELGQYLPLKKGVFGADMQIETHCDGPVTILIDSRRRKQPRN